MKIHDKLKSAIFPNDDKGKKNGKKTTLTIKYDCGFNNWLAIRGNDAPLSWEKGLPLRNVATDEWVFETEAPFTSFEYKILLNDEIYESGDNKILHHGTTVQHTPKF